MFTISTSRSSCNSGSLVAWGGDFGCGGGGGGNGSGGGSRGGGGSDGGGDVSFIWS